MNPDRTDGRHSYYDGEQQRAIVTAMRGNLSHLSAIDFYRRVETGWHRTHTDREIHSTAQRRAYEWAKGA